MGGYIDATESQGRAFFMRERGTGSPITMLNLLRFRDVADYSASPELAPAAPISGQEAYQRYMAHTVPFLDEAGGELLFKGDASAALIGPEAREWDLVLLVKHQSAEAFLSFAQNDAYKAGLGHRTAALADSRLIPLT